MKYFLFLYPIKEYFNQEINDWSYGYIARNSNKLKEKDIASDIEINKILKNEFKEKCKDKFNYIIDLYRNKDYVINFLTFDDKKVCDMIRLQEHDKILSAGITFEEHTTKNKDGTYNYASNEHVISQLNDVKKLSIGGFHLNDCVKRIADYSRERGIHTTIDKNLTEIGIGRINLSVKYN